MRREVHQFLPSLGFRDAVGTHTLCTRDALAGAGIKGGIWAEDVHPDLRRHAHTYTGYARKRTAKRGRNVLLYQASTGSRGLAEELIGRPEPMAIYYHNITPARFFEAYDPGAAANLARGREELKMLVGRAEAFMANSEHSARELRELGASGVDVVPPYLPPALSAAPDPDLLDWLRRTKRGTDVLFVGRIVPNKGHRHLLRAYAALREAVDPRSRLFVVGAWGPEPYVDELFGLRERLGSDGIVFTGSIAAPHLAAYYAAADVFVCLSEHEGFGLPLLEAMRADVPVVAYDAAAVGETLAGTGILLGTLDPTVVAEVVGRVSGLRDQLVEGQRRRVEELEWADRDARMVDLVRRVAT